MKLTDAELHLLRKLAAKPGAAVPRTLLAQKELGVFDRSIDVQVTRLRRKIEDDPRVPQHLKTVRGIGYALMTD
ncbi:MAG: helix-turn-helix domain-containing protein [Parvularcula sp.]|nr:helix-turn-helix domain-containing protein [Parvularcula sp.]